MEPNAEAVSDRICKTTVRGNEPGEEDVESEP